MANAPLPRSQPISVAQKTTSPTGDGSSRTGLAGDINSLSPPSVRIFKELEKKKKKKKKHQSTSLYIKIIDNAIRFSFVSELLPVLRVVVGPLLEAVAERLRLLMRQYRGL